MATKMISSARAIQIVFAKEVIDNARDRRTLMTIFGSMMLGPVLLLSMMWFVQKKVDDETNLVSSSAVELPVIGAELAPNLMSYLAQHHFEVVEAPDDPNASVKAGEYRAILVIEPEFGAALKAGTPAPVRIIYDSSISGLDQLDYEQLQSTLYRYSQTLAALRLQARGVSPQVLQAISVNTSDVATPEARGAQLLNMVPYIVVLSIMLGGMYLAIDTTAGEREKGSLEPLLAQPVDRGALVVGKWLATCFYSAVTFSVVLFGFAFAAQLVPLEGVAVQIPMDALIFILLTCSPFVLLGASVLILLAAFTKSTKEAQSYSSFVAMVPTLPLIMLMLLSPQPDASNMWIPSFSQGLIMIESLKGESIEPSLIAMSMLTSALAAMVALGLAVSFYRRERILG